jgi:hypothetical protein
LYSWFSRYALGHINVQTILIYIAVRPLVPTGLGLKSSDLCCLLSDIYLRLLCHVEAALHDNSPQEVAITGSDPASDHPSVSSLASLLAPLE